MLAGLLTTVAWKASHLVVWFPDHILRWIGSSGSPMGTDGEAEYPWDGGGGGGGESFSSCRKKDGEGRQGGRAGFSGSRRKGPEDRS